MLVHAESAPTAKSPKPSPSTQPKTEVDEALAELKAAMKKLENAVSHEANDKTAGLRKDVEKTVGNALHEMSKALEEASRQIQSGEKPIKTKPSAAPEKSI